MSGTCGKRRKRERSWSPGCRMLQIFKLSCRIGGMDVDNVVAGVIVDDCLMLLLRIPASLPSSKSSGNNKRTGSVSQYLKGLADLQTCSWENQQTHHIDEQILPYVHPFIHLPIQMSKGQTHGFTDMHQELFETKWLVVQSLLPSTIAVWVEGKIWGLPRALWGLNQ